MNLNEYSGFSSILIFTKFTRYKVRLNIDNFDLTLPNWTYIDVPQVIRKTNVSVGVVINVTCNLKKIVIDSNVNVLYSR